MTDLLDLVVNYLALHTGLTAGSSIFYNEIPTDVSRCVLVQEVQTNNSVPAQIDAELHRIKVTARDIDNIKTSSLAELCWRWLLTDNVNFDLDKREDTTGFIALLPDTTVQVTLYGNPVWEKSDQQGRKYYFFYVTILCKR